MQTPMIHTPDVTQLRRFQGLERLLIPGPTLDLHHPQSAGRKTVEDYIARQFNQIHGASIRHFMPQLLSMNCKDQPITALGMRSAESGDLFLEQYLPRAIESFVSKVAGKFVSRSAIVEIGNLVSTQRGGSQLLFIMLTALLEPSHFDWVVFTATPQVHKTMTRMGMTLHELYEADPALLTKSHISEWGTYYDCRPKVVAVSVAAAMQTLLERKTYANVIALYQSRLQALVPLLSQYDNDDRHPLSA